MGEIKSTLDLVMEKTRNLSLSQEERQNQRNKEIEGRIRGLLQKYQDQLISVERFKSEYRILQKDGGLPQNDLLTAEICRQIELGKDNQPLLELLAQFGFSDLAGISNIQREFQGTLDKAAQERIEILKDKLAETHSISGSAVVPNLEIDPGWRKTAGEIQARFERLLSREKTRLLDDA
jgi:hypothetical protein